MDEVEVRNDPLPLSSPVLLYPFGYSRRFYRTRRGLWPPPGGGVGWRLQWLAMFKAL